MVKVGVPCSWQTASIKTINTGRFLTTYHGNRKLRQPDPLPSGQLDNGANCILSLYRLLLSAAKFCFFVLSYFVFFCWLPLITLLLFNNFEPDNKFRRGYNPELQGQLSHGYMSEGLLVALFLTDTRVFL